MSAEQRCERILLAASKVFGERGYHGASIAAIAGEAGITAAVVYDHFDSKAQLQITLLERHTTEVLTFIATALLAAPEDPAGRMRVGVDAFFAFVEQHPHAWRQLFRDPPADPAVAECHRRVTQQATDAIAAFLVYNAPPHARERPEAQRDAQMLARMLEGAQNALAGWWYDHRDIPREILVDRVIELCWTGLANLSRERHTTS